MRKIRICDWPYRRDIFIVGPAFGKSGKGVPALAIDLLGIHGTENAQLLLTCNARERIAGSSCEIGKRKSNGSKAGLQEGEKEWVCRSIGSEAAEEKQGSWQPLEHRAAIRTSSPNCTTPERIFSGSTSATDRLPRMKNDIARYVNSTPVRPVLLPSLRTFKECDSGWV